LRSSSHSSHRRGRPDPRGTQRTWSGPWPSSPRSPPPSPRRRGFPQGMWRSGQLGLPQTVEEARGKIARARGEDPALVLSAERHAAAVSFFEQVTEVGHAHVGWRERADDLLMHPLLGYLFLGLILFGLFWAVFKVGGILEGLLLPPLEELSQGLGALLGQGLFSQLMVGAFQGLWAGVAIVLPYLVPFLFLLALLEDVGYLPRVGYLMDALMHRIGLHGKSVIPFLLGYGCSVPAVLATRILEDERDRLVTAALAVMVPCAGRAIVVFGLVGRYVGPLAAFGLYAFNLVVIALAGWLLARLLPGTGPGLIMEIPPYRRPNLHTLLGKVWLRLKDFVVVAWPLLIGTSALFALLQALGWSPAGAPEGGRGSACVWHPAQGTVPGDAHPGLWDGRAFPRAQPGAKLSSALSQGQMVVFAGFVLFYMPCLATLAALGRELGPRKTGLVLLGTTGVALVPPGWPCSWGCFCGGSPPWPKPAWGGGVWGSKGWTGQGHRPPPRRWPLPPGGQTTRRRRTPPGPTGPRIGVRGRGASSCRRRVGLPPRQGA